MTKGQIQPGRVFIGVNGATRKVVKVGTSLILYRTVTQPKGGGFRPVGVGHCCPKAFINWALKEVSP